jgi:hypothetical protein
MFVTVGVMAQGQILFQSKVTTAGLDAKILGPGGVALPANTLTAQLGYALSATAPITWTGITAPVNAAGYFAGGTKIVDGVAAGVDAWFAVRAYDGASWPGATLTTSPISSFGPLKLTALPSPPTAMAGMQGFSVVPVPEPSILALGVLGMGAFMLRRRS